VDARSLLRRYLEQRREAGERELLLDDLSVEAVMRLVGAVPTGAAGAAGAVAEQLVDRPVAPIADRARAAAPAEAPLVTPRPEPAAAPRAARGPVPAATPVAPPPAGPATDGPAGTSIDIGAAGGELFNGFASGLATLDDVAAAATACTRCSLSATATRCVPGEGSPTSRIVCVGEAPGETEDETGRPFVGRAGQLLTQMLAAIDVARADAFICNVLKHRPPGNRNPSTEEVAACSPFLVRQIEILRPRVILAFGTFAAQTLLQSTRKISELRGIVHRYHGVPLIATFHPAALLRNQTWKRPAWDDLKLARRIIDGTSTADA
jgi:DNA polymerase